VTAYPSRSELIAMIIPVVQRASAAKGKRITKEHARKLINTAISDARKHGKLAPDPEHKRPDRFCAWARDHWPELRQVEGFPYVETYSRSVGISIQSSWESLADELGERITIPKKRADLEAAYRRAEAARQILLQQLADCAHVLESKLLQQEDLRQRRLAYLEQARDR
jgi:hypothetical protein